MAGMNNLLRSLIVALSLLLAQASVSGVWAAERLPIIDMHVHYNKPAWEVFEPEYIRQLFEKAGVTRVLVSSWPDKGSRLLKSAHPKIVVPSFRPYVGEIMARNWTRHPQHVMPHMRERLAKTRYAGIGEIHIYNVNDVDWDVVSAVMKVARQNNLFLHVHCVEDVIDRLYEIDPDIDILWAHTGLGLSAEIIDATMAKHKNLMAELSLRAINILPNLDDVADPDITAPWRKVLMAYQDRLMIGTDTYINFAWADYVGLVEAHRKWLAKLPPEVAQKIAHKNAEAFIAKWYGEGKKN